MKAHAYLERDKFPDCVCKRWLAAAFLRTCRGRRLVDYFSYASTDSNHKKEKERKGETSAEAREKEGKGGKRLTTWVLEWYDGTTRDDKESRALQGAAATSPVHLANFLVN